MLEVNTIIKSSGIIVRPDFKKQSLKFTSTDSEEMFEKNKNNPEMLDIYKDDNNKLIYNFNSLGYRTKDMEWFENKDYILVFGCSYTEGIGLHESDIWHYHISKKLNIPIMNLGAGGTGPDYILLNIMKFLKNIRNYPTPKMVVIQWPGEYRKYFTSLGRLYCHVPAEKLLKFAPSEMYYDAEWYHDRYLPYDSLQKLHNYNCIQTAKLLLDLAGIKNYHWAWHDDQPNDYDIITKIRTLDKDKARDMAHPGPDVHMQVYSQIIEGVTKCLNG